MVISKVAIAICTHNPILEKLEKVVLSILNNSIHGRILIIDNASTNSVPSMIAQKYQLNEIMEPRLGNAYARFTAIQNVEEAELLIFVDDDNYLDCHYIEEALKLANENSVWGAFGGKQLQNITLDVEKFFKPLLPYVAIRDLGPRVLEVDATLNWSEIEPVGAGMCLNPRLVHYLKTYLTSNDHYFLLGRKGSATLSGEDSFIARSAYFLGMKWGYSPKLELVHDINQDRLSMKYMARLLYSYGISDIHLDNALGNSEHYPYPTSLYAALKRWFYTTIKYQGGWIIGLRHFGQRQGFKHLSLKS